MKTSKNRSRAYVAWQGGLACWLKGLAFASLACGGSWYLGVGLANAGQLVQDTNFTAAIFQYIEQSEYDIRWIDDQTVYKAANRAQNLRFTFLDDGFAAEPRDYGEGNPKPWEMTMRLQSLGKSGVGARTVEEGRWVVARNTASMDAAGISLEYTNDKAGLRQNFRVVSPPAGDEPLRLVIEVQSQELTFTVHEDGNVVSFVNAAGKEVARYRDLNVWDANQRPLAARMVKSDEAHFAIVVADAGASYPILVDPLYVEWGDTETQSGAKFGFSTAYGGYVQSASDPGSLLIGAPYFDTGQYADAGKVFLYFGTYLPDNPTWTKEGDQAYGYFGWSVASCGNVYGSSEEAYDDVIIGAPYYDSGGYYDNGKVFVFAGSTNGLDSTPIWTNTENQSYAHMGWSVTGIRDINADGYGEFAYGIPDYDYNGANDTGIVRVCAGSESGPSQLNILFGSGTGSRLGVSLSATTPLSGFDLADINGDDIADLVAGAPNWSSTGAVRVYFGSQNGFGASVTTLYGESSGDQFGFSVAAIGDTDGDSYGDVLVGAPFYDNGQSNEGKAYLFLGTSNGINTSASWTVESNQAGAELGYSVAGGPVDYLDGLSDLIIGAPYYDSTEWSLTDNGKAWLYLGVYYDDPSLESMVLGTDSYDHNGWSVAYGYRIFYRTPGVIVGAPDADGGGTVTASYWEE